jgi:carboxyl-terminal processing protease
MDTVMPMVVLVNRGSASASEIVAGALQDLDRAAIIGQRTFGKGLVQTTRSLNYNTQLKVTTAKYYIPSAGAFRQLIMQTGIDGSVGIIDS